MAGPGAEVHLPAATPLLEVAHEVVNDTLLIGGREPRRDAHLDDAPNDAGRDGLAPVLAADDRHPVRRRADERRLAIGRVVKKQQPIVAGRTRGVMSAVGRRRVVGDGGTDVAGQTGMVVRAVGRLGVPMSAVGRRGVVSGGGTGVAGQSGVVVRTVAGGRIIRWGAHASPCVSWGRMGAARARPGLMDHHRRSSPPIGVKEKPPAGGNRARKGKRIGSAPVGRPRVRTNRRHRQRTPRESPLPDSTRRHRQPDTPGPPSGNPPGGC